MNQPLNILCPHFEICSGCSINKAVNLPPVLKEAEEFFKEKRVKDFVLHTESPIEWRYRAKLAVRGDFANPIIGLFKEGTHEAISIPSCRVHHSQINEAVKLVRSFIQREKISLYNELTGDGDLRYIQIVVEKKTGKVQLSLVLNQKQVSQLWKNRTLEFFNAYSNFWHSLWINLNIVRTNVIFGSEWIFCAGEEWMWEKIGRANVCFQPSSFAQANLVMFEKLLQRIEDLLPSQARVAEFYAGGGVIGLNLLHKSEWVRCCEINPHAEKNFNKACDLLTMSEQAKISFETGEAGKLHALMKEANVVIVDPPRKGLDKGLINAFNDFQEVETLFYVSCGWDSFKKDCETLLSNGWSLNTAEAYLFFPGSNHIETLATFKRK